MADFEYIEKSIFVSICLIHLGNQVSILFYASWNEKKKLLLHLLPIVKWTLDQSMNILALLFKKNHPDFGPLPFPSLKQIN